MKLILRAYGVFSIVEGDEIEPEEPPEPVNGRARNCYEVYEKKLAEYEDRQNLAASLLYSSLSDRVRLHMSSIQDAPSIWTVLKRKYDKAQTETGAKQFHSQLFTEKVKDGESISSYNRHMIGIQTHLAGVNKANAPNDHIIISLILKAAQDLPKPAETVQHILDRPNELQTIDYVQSQRSLEEQEQHDADLLDAPKSIALHTKQARSNDPQKKPWIWKHNRRDQGRRDDHNENEKCWYCLKTGHLQKDCNLRKQAHSKRNERRKRQRLGARQLHIELKRLIHMLLKCL